MYRYRVKVPGGSWTRWANWNTTPSSVLLAESKRSK